MAHYKIEEKDYATLYSEYPHDPGDPILSIADFLEERFSQGWTLLSLSWHSTSNATFVFVPNSA